MDATTWFVKILDFALITLSSLILIGCVNRPPAKDLVCVDTDSESVNVNIKNDFGTDVYVPVDPPNMVCCNSSGLSLFLSEEGGGEIRTCGYSDNFVTSDMKNVHEGDVVSYSYSERSIRGRYCGVDVVGAALRIEYIEGVSGRKFSKAVLIGNCVSTSVRGSD